MSEKENTTYLEVAYGSDVPFVFNSVSVYLVATTAQENLSTAMSASCAVSAHSGNVSKGTVALPVRTEAYQQRDSASEARIMGSPSDVMAVINSSVPIALELEVLARRCAFRGSESVRH